MLGRGESNAVFQFESQGMQNILKEAKPNDIEDLVALNALYRPGPMAYIPQFINCKLGKQPITYANPELEEELKTTYGVIVYQEQVMNIAQVMSGFSMADADKLRKAMGKKIASLMEEQHEKFVKGAIEKGHSEKLAEDVFAMLEKFAEYGFNRAHAACYGLLSYQTAYLKANYPPEYMCSLLNTFRADEKRVETYIDECRILGIPILPPDINKSQVLFSLEKTNKETSNSSSEGDTQEWGIRFGLASIKNVGEAALEAIISQRNENGSYTGIKGFKNRNKTNKVTKRTVEFLIKAGAFDYYNRDRAGLLDEIQTGKKDAPSLFGGSVVQEEKPSNNGDSSIETNLLFEKEALGFYISMNPMVQFLEAFPNIEFYSLHTLKATHEDTDVPVFCMIDSLRVPRKKTTNMVRMCNVSDLSGSAELVCFGDVAKEIDEIVRGETDGIKAFHLQVKVSHFGDSTRHMIKKISRIYTLSDVHKQLQKPSRLFISLNLDQLHKENLEKIAGILQSHPGSSEVFFQLHYQGYFIETLPSFNFHVTRSMELTTELQRLLSNKDIWWQRC